jgi:predicted dehydrogenase
LAGKYSTLIIGAGGQGAMADYDGSGNESKILSYTKAILYNKNFNPPIIYDSNVEKAKIASNLWKINYIDKLDYDYDVICIATPDDTHYEILKNIPRSVRLVICEKPICTDLADARTIVKSFERKHIPILVDYTRRFIPYLKLLKLNYSRNKYGNLLDYNICFNRGNSHTGSHAIDFMRWFFNVDSVEMNEMANIPYRVWKIELFFESFYWKEERILDMEVPSYYNTHMMHVIENAYNFLSGEEGLMCTGEDALKTLELCYKKG